MDAPAVQGGLTHPDQAGDRAFPVPVAGGGEPVCQRAAGYGGRVSGENGCERLKTTENGAVWR